MGVSNGNFVSTVMTQNRSTELTMKVVGGKLPSAWDRFDRLQRTVAAIRPQPDAHGLSPGARVHETFVRETGGGYAKPDPPRESDLVALCRAMNNHDVRYAIVGGMAIVHHGFVRATEDIDVLLESSDENIRRALKALEFLPDGAVLEVTTSDLRSYQVVRVVDAVVVDLMLSTCGVPFDEAAPDLEIRQVDGVDLPFVSAAVLHRMKQTGREKDELDLRFLEEKLKQKG